MDIWDEMNSLYKSYYENKQPEMLEKMIKCLEPYLKSCANNSVFKGESVNVYIPFEDFYSNYLVASWEAIEDFAHINNTKLKNVIIRRIVISEKKVWRMYRKKSASKYDKNGITYASAQWESLDLIGNEMKDNDLVGTLTIQLAIKKYRECSTWKGELIYLLYSGYSCRESCQLMNISDEYDNKTRKKIQRVRQEFKNLIKTEEFNS